MLKEKLSKVYKKRKDKIDIKYKLVHEYSFGAEFPRPNIVLLTNDIKTPNLFQLTSVLTMIFQNCRIFLLVQTRSSASYIFVNVRQVILWFIYLLIHINLSWFLFEVRSYVIEIIAIMRQIIFANTKEHECKNRFLQFEMCIWNFLYE